MVKAAIFGIIAIVVVSIVAVVVLNNVTNDSKSGLLTSSYGYGAAKLYGPGLKRAHMNPSLTENGDYNIKSAQEFMYANQDKWLCQYAEPTGDDPCLYDYDKSKWCCIPTEQNFKY